MSTKNPYRQQIEAQLQAEVARLKSIQTSVRNAVELSRTAAREELGRIEGQITSAREKVTELTGSSGAAMQELRNGVQKALAELEEARKKAASKFDRPA